MSEGKCEFCGMVRPLSGWSYGDGYMCYDCCLMLATCGFGIGAETTLKLRAEREERERQEGGQP